ncbi:DEAD-box ATP-dependent RNA helicase 57 [Tanacetum coccineum]
MHAIPILLSGSDVFACAPTGSGKTLPFVCPILMKLMIQRASKDGVRAVILCLTRELASQTYRECKELAKGNEFYIKLMTKQLSNTDEFAKFSCDVLISTPLYLKSFVTKRKLDLSRVEYLVLDESDKLFELGLLEPVDAIVKACTNPSIIHSLFSATLPDTVEELARAIMHDVVHVIIGTKFLALGWNLEEIHVTWAHLEKKRTRIRLYTKNHEELFTQSLETASQP